MFKIRFNNRSYLVQVIETTTDYIAIRFPSGEEEWVCLKDWSRYLQNQQEFEEDQRNG